MWIVLGVLLVVLFFLFWLRRRVNNAIVLIATNVTYIYEILRHEYRQRFPDEDTLLMTAGAIDILVYLQNGSYSIEDMRAAVVNAKAGECCLDVVHCRRVESIQEFMSGGSNILLNFIMQLEAMILYEDTSTRPEDILEVLVSQKNNIQKIIERTQGSFASGRAPRNFCFFVSNVMTADEFEDIRNELGIVPVEANQNTHPIAH